MKPLISNLNIPALSIKKCQNPIEQQYIKGYSNNYKFNMQID